MVCGLEPSLSLIVTNPVRAPVTVGLNVTLSVQLPFGARLLGQLLFTKKSPVTSMLPITIGVLLTLVRDTVFAALVIPTFSSAKATDAGTRSTPVEFPTRIRIRGL